MRKVQLVQSSQSYEQDISLTNANIARNHTSLMGTERVLAQVTGGEFGGWGGGSGWNGCSGGNGWNGRGGWNGWNGGGGWNGWNGCGGFGYPYACGVPFAYGGYYNAINSGFYGGYGPSGGY